MFIITEEWGLCPVVNFKKSNLLLFNMYRHPLTGRCLAVLSYSDKVANKL